MTITEWVADQIATNPGLKGCDPKALQDVFEYARREGHSEGIDQLCTVERERDAALEEAAKVADAHAKRHREAQAQEEVDAGYGGRTASGDSRIAAEAAESVAAAIRALKDSPERCRHCRKTECECSDSDVSPDMGAKG